MSEFKIRAIQDVKEEPNPYIIGIDTFDDIDTNDIIRDYYCAAMVLNNDGQERRIPHPNVYFGSQSSFDNGIGLSVNPMDIYPLPTPQMYGLLGEALKMKGMIFNKKKCRFEVRKKGEI